MTRGEEGSEKNRRVDRLRLSTQWVAHSQPKKLEDDVLPGWPVCGCVALTDTFEIWVTTRYNTADRQLSAKVTGSGLTRI